MDFYYFFLFLFFFHETNDIIRYFTIAMSGLSIWNGYKIIKWLMKTNKKQLIYDNQLTVRVNNQSFVENHDLVPDFEGMRRSSRNVLNVDVKPNFDGMNYEANIEEEPMLENQDINS